jgi:hypothetical protein
MVLVDEFVDECDYWVVYLDLVVYSGSRVCVRLRRLQLRQRRKLKARELYSHKENFVGHELDSWVSSQLIPPKSS